jgi:hypothetical protein
VARSLPFLFAPRRTTDIELPLPGGTFFGGQIFLKFFLKVLFCTFVLPVHRSPLLEAGSQSKVDRETAATSLLHSQLKALTAKGQSSDNTSTTEDRDDWID